MKVVVKRLRRFSGGASSNEGVAASSDEGAAAISSSVVASPKGAAASSRSIVASPKGAAASKEGSPQTAITCEALQGPAKETIVPVGTILLR